MKLGMSKALLLLALPAIFATCSNAAPINPGKSVLPTRAIQDITLLPNTPFNPTASPILIDDLYGDGDLILNRAGQVGSTIAIPSASALYYGFHPMLGSYTFGSVAPLTPNDFPGTGITNVVQNVNDPGFATGAESSLLSATLKLGGPSFGFEFLTGPAAGLKLFTDPTVPFEFTMLMDGLPPSVGSVLQNSGPAVLNVLFDGQIVATSSDRRIFVSAVPEPSSLSLVLVATALFTGYRVRRGRRS